MSYFNAPNTTFTFPGAQPIVPSAENQPPKNMWCFPQTSSSSSSSSGTKSFGNVSVPNQVTASNSKPKIGRKKRSSTMEEECENVQMNCYAAQAPTKRRRGLTDATRATVNSAATYGYWGQRS